MYALVSYFDKESYILGEKAAKSGEKISEKKERETK